MNDTWPPISPIDHRKLILSANWIIIGVCTLLAGIRFFTTGFEYLPFPLLITEVGCVANIIFIKRSGALDKAAMILVALLLAVLGLGGFNNYGFHGSLVLMSPLIPIFTILLLGVRAAVITLILTLLILLSLLVLELCGLVPENPSDGEWVTLGRFLILVVLCLVAAWGVWRFTNYSRQLLVRIETQATTDHLTGALNRRGIEVMLSREHAGAKRQNSQLSLIIMDVDFFKRYNDINGHQAGDDCLVEITGVIKSSVARDTDLVGRYGGEEFVVILPDTSIEGACTVAEKIRAGLAERSILYGADKADFVTLTLGVAGGEGEDLSTVEDLVRAADKALYLGKKQGRNRVVRACMKSEASAGRKA